MLSKSRNESGDTPAGPSISVYWPAVVLILFGMLLDLFAVFALPAANTAAVFKRSPSDIAGIVEVFHIFAATCVGMGILVLVYRRHRIPETDYS